VDILTLSIDPGEFLGSDKFESMESEERVGNLMKGGSIIGLVSGFCMLHHRGKMTEMTQAVHDAHFIKRLRGCNIDGQHLKLRGMTFVQAKRASRLKEFTGKCPAQNFEWRMKCA
jgi:hypothetical protein